MVDRDDDRGRGKQRSGRGYGRALAERAGGRLGPIQTA